MYIHMYTQNHARLFLTKSRPNRNPLPFPRLPGVKKDWPEMVVSSPESPPLASEEGEEREEGNLNYQEAQRVLLGRQVYRSTSSDNAAVIRLSPPPESLCRHPTGHKSGPVNVRLGVHTVYSRRPRGTGRSLARV
jgi:hypothetical protein